MECNLQRCSRKPQDSDGKAISARHKAAAPSNTVPDDWDEASSSEEEDNQKIWDNAYGIFLCNLLTDEYPLVQKQEGSDASARRDVLEDGTHLERRTTDLGLSTYHSHPQAFCDIDSKLREQRSVGVGDHHRD